MYWRWLFVFYHLFEFNVAGEVISPFELGNIFLHEGYGNPGGTMVTVTIVRMAPDLSFAKVYLSVFPQEKATEILEAVKSNMPLIKHDLA